MTSLYPKVRHNISFFNKSIIIKSIIIIRPSSPMCITFVAVVFHVDQHHIGDQQTGTFRCQPDGELDLCITVVLTVYCQNFGPGPHDTIISVEPPLIYFSVNAHHGGWQ